MTIFSKLRSSKSKTDLQEPQTFPDADSAPVLYKHVPTHAATDSAIGLPGHADRERILHQNQRRMSEDSSPEHSSVAMAPFQQSRQSHTSTSTRRRSKSFFVTDPDAPPMPFLPPIALDKFKSQGQQKVASMPAMPKPALARTSNNSNGYFQTSADASSGVENNMGNPKSLDAAKDGESNAGVPNTEADSGYDSNSDSRSPSLNGQSADPAGSPEQRENDDDSVLHSDAISPGTQQQPQPQKQQSMQQPRQQSLDDYSMNRNPSETVSNMSGSKARPMHKRNSSQFTARSIPAVSILDGLKVNKKGKLLDEEGEVIGELVDGDMLDCVRQRVNAYGEVLDEKGKVVGHVRAIGDIAEESEPEPEPEPKPSKPGKAPSVMRTSQPSVPQQTDSNGGSMSSLNNYTYPTKKTGKPAHPAVNTTRTARQAAQPENFEVSPVDDFSASTNPNDVSHDTKQGASLEMQGTTSSAQDMEAYEFSRSISPVPESPIDFDAAPKPMLPIEQLRVDAKPGRKYSYNGPLSMDLAAIHVGPAPSEIRAAVARRMSTQKFPPGLASNNSAGPSSSSSSSAAQHRQPSHPQGISAHTALVNTSASPYRMPSRKGRSRDGPIGKSPLATGTHSPEDPSEESGGSETSDHTEYARSENGKSITRPGQAWQLQRTPTYSGSSSPYAHQQSFYSMSGAKSPVRPNSMPQKTYFTHAGRLPASELDRRIAEEEAARPPPGVVAAPEPAPAPAPLPAPEPIKEKKKGMFNLRRGKSSSSVVTVS